MISANADRNLAEVGESFEHVSLGGTAPSKHYYELAEGISAEIVDLRTLWPLVTIAIQAL